MVDGLGGGNPPRPFGGSRRLDRDLESAVQPPVSTADLAFPEDRGCLGWARYVHLAWRMSNPSVLTVPGSRRIPSRIWNAELEAEALLSRAREEASEILRRAEQEAALARLAAAEAGREEGLASVTELSCRAAMAKQKTIRQMEGEVIDLAMAVARSIVEAAVERDSEALLVTATRALERARRRAEVTIRANPRDVARLGAAEDALLERLAVADRIAVIPDPEIEVGGVLVITEAGTIDARLDCQLEGVRRALTQDHS